MANAIVEEYRTSLEDLTFNSKPHINALTMLAEEYLPQAEHVVHLIEAQLNKAVPNGKLPLMYLMDSIVKNVGGNYTPLFAKNIVQNFFTTFDMGDEKTKISLHKLRSTWDNYFPLKKLYELDVTIHTVDPNWPVKPLPQSLQDKPSTSIHVNPKFLKKTESPAPSISNVMSATVRPSTSNAIMKDSIDLKQDLINKQKQLLDLQQQKLLLELEQTKQQLALREKRNAIAARKQGEATIRDPRVKQAASVPAAGLRVTVVNGQKPSQTSNATARDPRSQTAGKPKPSAPHTTLKKESASIVKSETGAKVTELPKKSLGETTTAKPAKSPPQKSSDNTKTTKHNKSPVNATKISKLGSKTVSPKRPKLALKSEAGKKTKGKKNQKVEPKTLATNKSEKSSKSELKKSDRALENDHGKARSDGPEKTSKTSSDKVKKRDRPTRKSPPHSGPPVKQARRSTSVERRRSPPPPRRQSDGFHKGRLEKPRHQAIREEERKRGRDSPRSTDGSLSPRFSPEPDEPSPVKNWKPSAKQGRSPFSPWVRDGSIPGARPTVRRRSSVDPNIRIPQELTLSHQAEILKQAEIQLQTGQLTHGQHQELLKQLHQLFELQRIRNLQLINQSQGIPIQHLVNEQRKKEALERRNSSEHERIPMQMQDENRTMPAFRPPPSPPQMDVHDDSENFAPIPFPQRTLGDPRPIRMPEPRKPFSGRDPRVRNPPTDSLGPHFKRPDFPNRDNESRLPPRDRHPGPRPGIPRRGSFNRDDFARAKEHLEGAPSPPQFDSHFGPYVIDEEDEKYLQEKRKEEESAQSFFDSREESGPSSPKKHSIESNFTERFEESQHPERRDDSKRRKRHDDESHDGKKVALRVYARPDVENIYGQPGDKVDRSTHVDGGSKQEKDEPRRSLPKVRRNEGRHHRKGSPNWEATGGKDEGSENEDDGPRLEEPEDYIIASIPPEAEVYHKHSISLKRTKSEEKAYHDHKKNILLSTCKKKLADQPGNGEDGEKAMSPLTDATENVPSPEPSKKEKMEEEVNKSPSLPLKKRKYLISASDFSASDVRTDSSDGGVVTESESEVLDSASKDQAPTSEEPRIKEDEHLLKEEVEPKETAEDNGDVMAPQDTGSNTPDTKQDIEEENKADIMEPMDEDGVSDPSVKKLMEEATKDEELKDVDKNVTKESTVGGVQKKQDGKRESKVKSRQRNKERGKRIGRQFVHGEEEYSHREEERLRSIMREEEQRIKWEEELAEQLKYEMMETRPSDRGGPPHRGWGRARGVGVQRDQNRERGRFVRGRGARGRGWRSGPDFWNEEMDDKDHFPRHGSPMDDGLPFHGRHPDRMPPHPDRMQERMIPNRHLPPRMNEDRMGDGPHRNWHGPPEGHRGPPPPHGFDHPWNENDAGPHPVRPEDRHTLMMRRRPGTDGHPDDHRFGPPHPPYHPEERPPLHREMNIGPGPHPRHFHPDHGPRMGEDFPPQPNQYAPYVPAAVEPPPGPEMNQLNVNKLLSDLLNMGIIPGNTNPPETTKPSSGPPSRNNSPTPDNQGPIHHSSAAQPDRPGISASSSLPTLTGPSVLMKTAPAQEGGQRVPTPVFYEEDLMTMDPDASIPEITLKDMDKLKIRCDELIKRLYTGIQCSACGMRFTARQTDMYAEHLDWHYRLNRKDKDGVRETHRKIYPTAGEWIMYEEIEDPLTRSHNQVFDEASQEEQIEGDAEPENPEDLVVPVRSCPDGDRCTVCKEPFTTVYNDEDDEWQFINCVLVDGKTFHPNCYADHSDNPTLEPLPTPIRVPLYNPLDGKTGGIPGLDTLMKEESTESEENEEKMDVQLSEVNPVQLETTALKEVALPEDSDLGGEDTIVPKLEETLQTEAQDPKTAVNEPSEAEAEIQDDGTPVSCEVETSIAEKIENEKAENSLGKSETVQDEGFSLNNSPAEPFPVAKQQEESSSETETPDEREKEESEGTEVKCEPETAPFIIPPTAATEEPISKEQSSMSASEQLPQQNASEVEHDLQLSAPTPSHEEDALMPPGTETDVRQVIISIGMGDQDSQSESDLEDEAQTDSD